MCVAGGEGDSSNHWGPGDEERHASCVYQVSLSLSASLSLSHPQPLTEIPRDKIMEMIHFISADRALVKKRIPADLMSGNVAAFPAATKSHFWGWAWVTVRLQHPGLWEAVCCFPACIQRAELSTESCYSAVPGLRHQAVFAHSVCVAFVCMFVLLLCVWYNPPLRDCFVCCCLSFNFPISLKTSSRSTHTLLSRAHSHIHTALHHKSHSRGLEGGRVGMWTSLNIDEPAAIDTLTNGGQKEEGLGFIQVLLKSITLFRLN